MIKIEHFKANSYPRFKSVLISFSLLAPLVFVILNFANAVVSVQTNSGSTLMVALNSTTTIGAADTSSTFDFSSKISRPSSNWSDSDLIAVEIALTSGTGATAGADNAPVFRGSGNCMVDVSSDATTNGFGTTAANGSNTISGNTVFILNDRTPQVSIQGSMSAVVTALQAIKVSCNNNSDLAGKYVRVGAVPTISSSSCAYTTGAVNSTTQTCGDLYYVFSTQHYYRTMTASSGNSVQDLMAWSQSANIPVNGTNKSGSTIYGWNATLKNRDEIILTNAIGSGSRQQIGTTDLNSTWSWNSNWGGTSPGDCTTSEGEFKWLGPDNWCELVPTWNHLGTTSYGTTSRYWKLGSDGNWSRSTSSDYTIDFGSTSTPTSEADVNHTNGYNVYHSWHTGANGAPDEPNSSGDWIYQGYAGSNNNPGWDDAGQDDGLSGGRVGATSGATQNYYVEFCSGKDSSNTCAPPDAAVSSTQLKLAQTVTFSGASSSYTTQNVSLSRATTTSNLAITYSSSDTNICTTSSADDGTNVSVTLVSRGTCTITASQAGDTNYLAATSVSQSFNSFYGALINTSSCPGNPAIYTDTGTGRFGLNGGFETPESAYTLPLVNGHAMLDARSDSNTTRQSASNNGRAQWYAMGLGINLTSSNADVDFGFTSSSINGVSPVSGTRYAEISGTYYSGIYQDISTVGGSLIRWRLYHRGRAGTDKMRVLIGTTSGTTSYSTSSNTYTISGTYSNATGELAKKDGSGTSTNDISDDSTAWHYWEGTYNVPIGQTTTRFLMVPYTPGSGNTSDSTGDAQGNLIDQVSFNPTMACPDTGSAMQGYGYSTNVAFNDYPKIISQSGGSVVSDLTLSTVGTWPSGFTLSGYIANVAATVTAGTYTVSYKITDLDGIESISTFTMTVLPQSGATLPDVILVDPQANYVDFPDITFSGSTNIMMCVFESNSSGAQLGSSALYFKFDAHSKGTVETNGPDGAPSTIANDRTNSITIYGALSRAQNSFNGSGGLRIYLDSPNIFNNTASTRYVRVQTQAISSTSPSSYVCSQALSATSKTIEIRRLGITKTIVKGTVPLKSP